MAKKQPTLTFRPASEVVPAIVALICGRADALATLNREHERAVTLNKAGMLADLVAAMHGVKPITADGWKADWQEPFKAALQSAKGADGQPRFKSDATISVTLSNYKVACIAISNGILPNAEETNFDLFWRGVRDRIPENILPAKKTVAPKAPAPSKDERIQALQAANAKLAEQVKAATAHVSDKAQAAAPVVADAKVAAEVLSKLPVVDVMVALMKHENVNASRDDAHAILAALRKNPAALLTVAKTFAA